MSVEEENVEKVVLAVLQDFSKALHSKDLDALAECYVDDVRVFDIGSQNDDFERLRQVWQSCLPYFTNPIGTQRKDVQIVAGTELAVATFYSRLTGMDSDHPSAKSWFRTTVCLRKVGETWKIFHDHVSLPVDCGAGKPTYLLDDPVC